MDVIRVMIYYEDDIYIIYIMRMIYYSVYYII